MCRASVSDRERQDDDTPDGDNLQECKNVLDYSSELHAEIIYTRDENDCRDCDEAHADVFQRIDVAYEGEFPCFECGTQMWKVNEISEIAGERNRNRGDGARLIDDEGRPSIQERRQVAVRDTKEHILPPRLRDHTGDFRIRQCAGEG